MSEQKIETIQRMGWTLARVDGAPEVRIHDLELGRRAGLSRPRDIRKTIQRLEKRGRLPGILPRDVVARCKNQHGVTDSTYEVTEYWLTRTEALKVVNALETPPAEAMQDEMIRVFELALDGKLPGQESAQLARINEALDRLVVSDEKRSKQLEALTARLSEVATTANETSRKVTVLDQRGNATLAPSEQKRLDELRRRVAQLLVDRSKKTPKSAWCTVKNVVESASGFCGPLKDLPLHRYGDAIRALEQLKKRLEETTDPNPTIPFGDKAA